jgi:hypothetical protein
MLQSRRSVEVEMEDLKRDLLRKKSQPNTDDALDSYLAQMNKQAEVSEIEANCRELYHVRSIFFFVERFYVSTGASSSRSG